MKNVTSFLFALTLGLFWSTNVLAQHNYGPNGVCTDEECTDPFQPAEIDEADGYYMLANAGNVEWFSNLMHNTPAAYNIKLTADIDMTGVAHRPIGHDGGDKFRGTCDGQGHRILNMVDFTVSDGVGFFGATRGQSTTIKNLIIDKSCQIVGTTLVGAIVGDMEYPPSPNYTTLENCINEAEVIGTGSQVGGLVGGVRYNDGAAYMVNCINRGNVSGTSQVGSLIGNTAGTSIIISSYNEGQILSGQNGNRNLVGGGNATFTGVADISLTEERGQGICLAPEAKGNGALCYALNGDQTEIKWTQTIGVDAAPVLGTSSKQVYGHGRKHCEGTPYEDMTYNNDPSQDDVQDDHNFVGGICSYCKLVDRDYVKPDADSVYHFSTVEHIEWFSAMVNREFYGGMKCVLDDDIDFGGVENAHTPIGNDGHKFFGQFDGQGHHIRGMVLHLSNIGSHGAGFFGSVRGGGTNPDGQAWNDTVIIRNLIIDSDCEVTIEGGNIGGVIGRINARNSDSNIVLVENCGNEANVTSLTGGGAAGVIGCVQGTTVGLIIRNCYNTGNISGTAECATICAWTGTAAAGLVKSFENCWNSGRLVSGLEGDRNLFRTPNVEAISNCYDAEKANVEDGGRQGVYEWQTVTPASSGELAAVLRGDKRSNAWHQTLIEDYHPVLDPTHGFVYGIDGEFGDVHDESTFATYSESMVSYERDLYENTMATQALLDAYLGHMDELAATETLDAFLDIYYDTLSTLRADIKTSVEAYKTYVAAVTEVSAKLAENTELTGVDRDKLDDYLLRDDAPGEKFPNGAYFYITETHLLTTEEVLAEAEYVQTLYDLALRNSGSAGTEVTNLIANPMFADGVEGWTLTGGVNTGGIKEVMTTAQGWNTTFDIHQTITGLQNGMYELVANGVFRSEPRDENHSYVGYMYANDTRVYLPTIFEDYLPIEEAKDSVNCYITPGASTLDIEIYDDNGLVGYAPQGLVGSSFHFKDGRYVNHLLVEVTDGTLTIGMANPGTGNANDWTGFSNFRLFYQGKGEEAISAADRTLAGMAARAETLGEYFGDISDYNAFPNFSTSLREALEDAKAQIETLSSIEDRMALIGRFSDIFAEIYDSRMAYRNYMNEVNYFLDKSGDFFLDGVIDDDTYTAIYDLTDEIIANLDLGMYSTEEALAQETLKASPSYVVVFGEEPEQDEDGWYLIKNALNVEWFSQYVARLNNFAKGKVMNDIDMAGIYHSPIGPSEQRKFNGQFDGQFHRILNMVINSTQNNQAFFGWVRGGGTVIKNLIIDKSCSVTAGDCSAGLIAKTQVYADAPIYVLNCVNEANITGGGATTGILGAQTSPYAYIIMHNCVNAGNITSTQELGDTKYASAFIGWHGDIGIGKNSELWNCLNIGEITPIEPGNNQLFRGTFRSWLNDYDVIYHDAQYQGEKNVWETENPVTSGELCWLLNQHETQGVSYKQTLGVDPYPLPIDDGKHLPVLKDEEGKYYNEGGDGIVTIHHSSSTNGEMYDLSGRRVEKATKGIYLQAGKKVLVK